MPDEDGKTNSLLSSAMSVEPPRFAVGENSPADSGASIAVTARASLRLAQACIDASRARADHMLEVILAHAREAAAQLLASLGSK